MSAGHVRATGEHLTRGNPTHPARQKASVQTSRELRLRERIDNLADRLALTRGELARKRADCRYLTKRVRELSRSRDYWRSLARNHERALIQGLPPAYRRRR